MPTILRSMCSVHTCASYGVNCKVSHIKPNFAGNPYFLARLLRMQLLRTTARTLAHVGISENWLIRRCQCCSIVIVCVRMQEFRKLFSIHSLNNMKCLVLLYKHIAAVHGVPECTTYGTRSCARHSCFSFSQYTHQSNLHQIAHTIWLLCSMFKYVCVWLCAAPFSGPHVSNNIKLIMQAHAYIHNPLTALLAGHQTHYNVNHITL